MLEIYSLLVEEDILWIMLLSTITCVVQIMHLVFSHKPKVEFLFEFLLSIYTAYLSILIVSISRGIRTGHIIIWNFKLYHHILCIIIIIGAIFSFKSGRKIIIFSGTLCALLSNPLLERLPYKTYTVLFIISLMLLLFRAIGLYTNSMYWKDENLTSYAFKESFDIQSVGILFFDEMYEIVLINKKMLILMEEVVGYQTRNAELFNDILTKQNFENKSTLYKTADGKIWQIKSTTILNKGKTLHQMTATDVTEQVKINEELELIYLKLSKQKNQLVEAIKHLEEIKKAEAMQKAWNHIHDKMGQQVSMIERLLKNAEKVTKEELLVVVDNIEKQFYIEEEKAIDIYKELKEDYEKLGVNLYLDGDFPKEKQTALILVEIIREGVTNAVRHGMAKNVYIIIKQIDKKLFMSIKNDGIQSDEIIAWGGGLIGIAKKIYSHGGDMKVNTRPEFEIEVSLNNDMSKGDIYDKITFG